MNNNGYPLRLPQRRFGDHRMQRVQYSSRVLGPIGWLHRKRGNVSLKMEHIARAVLPAFDHVEFWADTEAGGHVLVGHPYHFSERDRAAMVEASRALNFLWLFYPQEEGRSWYSRAAHLIVAQDFNDFVAAPAEREEFYTGKMGRRALKAGETEEDWVIVRKERTTYQKRRDMPNSEKYEALYAKQDRFAKARIKERAGELQRAVAWKQATEEELARQRAAVNKPPSDPSEPS